MTGLTLAAAAAAGLLAGWLIGWRHRGRRGSKADRAWLTVLLRQVSGGPVDFARLWVPPWAQKVLTACCRPVPRAPRLTPPPLPPAQWQDEATQVWPFQGWRT